MAIDLRALLAARELGLTLLTGERSLDRRVRWVMTTDLADPSRYLSGGELVLTGMMWRHDPDDSAAFVARLVAARVTALAAGDADSDEIPVDLVSACGRHGLPLFAVHPDVSFSEVTEYVVRRLSTARSADLAAVLDRHRSLIATGHDLGGVLELVSGETGMAAWVLSAAGRLLAGPADALPGAVPPAAVRRAAHAGTLPVLVTAEGRTFSVCAADGPPYVHGLVVVEDDHTRWPRERGDVADELVAVVGIELRQREHDAESAADLVALIDRGTEPDAVRARLRLAGLDGEGPFAVAVSRPAGRFDGRAALCVELLAQVAEALTWADAAEETVVLARVPAGARVSERVRESAAGLAHGLGDRRLAVGLAGPVPSVADLAAALAEARHAARIAETRPEPAAVVAADELASHVLLLAAAGPAAREAFRARVLGPVLAYDERHSSDLAHTLRAYLANSGSWAKCAAELHVHVNTLRYRIERVEALTGRDLRSVPDQVDLYLALQVPAP